MLSRASERISLMGDMREIEPLTEALTGAQARGVATRIISLGGAPEVPGQVVSYLGKSVSAPTRILVVIVDRARLLVATFAPEMPPTAVYSENRALTTLLTAFLNTEYYILRLANAHPTLILEVLDELLEAEDRERYAQALKFLEKN